MDRTLRNTIAVLVLTAFTALALFATVQVTARVTGLSSTVSSVSASAVQGQSATSSNGWNGDSQYYDQSGSSHYGNAQSTGQLMTCPRTGCTQTYCHATQ